MLLLSQGLLSRIVGSDTTTVRNFFTHSSDATFQGNQWQHCKMSVFCLRLLILLFYDLPDIKERLSLMYLKIAHWTIFAGLEVLHNTAFTN